MSCGRVRKDRVTQRISSSPPIRRRWDVACLALLFILAGCGGGDSDTAIEREDADTEVSAEVNEEAASDDNEAGETSAVDCAALQDSLEVLGLSYQLMAAAQPGQAATYLDDITDPEGVLVVDFDALEVAVEELRVLEPYGEETAGFLNNALELSGVIRAAVAGDEAARVAALDEIELITGGAELALTSQLRFGEAVAAAGC